MPEDIIPTQDFEKLFMAERDKREAMENDIRALAEIIVPIGKKIGAGSGGEINPMTAISVIGKLMMDSKFKASIAEIMPSLTKYEYLIK